MAYGTDCKYHIVWILKYRKKKLYGEAAPYLGEIFHDLAERRESKIVKGHVRSDILIEIPPKYGVSVVIGYIKGKNAIAIVRTYLGKEKPVLQIP
ncbi:MAG: IS200/IS605 family transposase [Treponema sp.]|nr:IS200/IS605 family transposase [Treponema sp.]